MSSEIGVENGQPMISVVVPVYNDPEGISATLDTVIDQTYPADQYEVIVADNGSGDNTCDVVRSYAEKHPELVTLVIEEQKQGPAAARNRGIENAHGTIFAFIDANMTVDRTWLESIVAKVLNGDHDYIGCRIKISVPNDGRTIAAEYDRLFTFDNQRYINELDFSGGGGLVVRKEVFEEVGRFDTKLVFGADREFGHRVRDAGFDQHYEPGITVYHPARASIADQIERGFRLGRGAVHKNDVFQDRFDRPDPFRIRRYLPVKPHSFLSNIEDKSVYTVYEMTGLYLIACIRKLSKSLGVLYESLGNTSTTRR